jgi:hypothetical protein
MPNAVTKSYSRARKYDANPAIHQREDGFSSFFFYVFFGENDRAVTRLRMPKSVVHVSRFRNGFPGSVGGR